jgi:hypothetical protein
MLHSSHVINTAEIKILEAVNSFQLLSVQINPYAVDAAVQAERFR